MSIWLLKEEDNNAHDKEAGNNTELNCGFIKTHPVYLQQLVVALKFLDF